MTVGVACAVAAGAGAEFGAVEAGPSISAPAGASERSICSALAEFGAVIVETVAVVAAAEGVAAVAGVAVAAGTLAPEPAPGPDMSKADA